MPVSVMLVDDHAVVREGLRLLLEAREGVRVVGQAASGEEAQALARALHPDVVVMDIGLPDIDGIETTHRLLADRPDIRVCMLSMHATLEYLYQALATGARGYVLKESAGAEVMAAVLAVSAGERYLSRKLVELLLDEFLQRRHPARAADALASLSPRELEIFKHVVAGASSKTIGELLFISPKTVETYRARLMEKLDIHDLPSLVRFGIEHGIDTP